MENNVLFNPKIGILQKGRKVKPMKIGLYTDPHYSSHALTCGKRYNSLSLQKIEEAYAYFQKESCELIVCLGDLIDAEATKEKVLENLSAIAEVIHSTEIPTVCLMGNHDAFTLDSIEFYRVLGLQEPQDMSLNGRRLLFLDACYFQNGRHYKPNDSGWTDTWYPFEEEMKTKLEALCGDTYLFIHQNIDPAVKENHRLSNAKKLFDEINQSGKVKAVFQGHFHAGCRSEYDGVRYVTLPAMCENERAFFVFDI